MPDAENSQEPFLKWPGWRLFLETLLLAGLFAVWWVLVYHGADRIVSRHSYRVRVHTDAELSIPFVPVSIVLYRSIDLMFFLGPFVLRTRSEVRGLVASLFTVTTVAGLFFMAFPANLAFGPAPHQGAWEPFFQWNREMVLEHNLAPSLHVALSVVTLAAYGRGGSAVRKGLMALWALLIAISTVLLHEHHILDVVTGFLLGWGGYELIYRRWISARANTEQEQFQV